MIFRELFIENFITLNELSLPKKHLLDSDQQDYAESFFPAALRNNFIKKIEKTAKSLGYGKMNIEWSKYADANEPRIYIEWSYKSDKTKKTRKEAFYLVLELTIHDTSGDVDSSISIHSDPLKQESKSYSKTIFYKDGPAIGPFDDMMKRNERQLTGEAIQMMKSTISILDDPSQKLSKFDNYQSY